MTKPNDKQPSELSALRAEYKELAGKNPSPSLTADKLREKIAELMPAANGHDQAPAPGAQPPVEQQPVADAATAPIDPASADNGASPVSDQDAPSDSNAASTSNDEAGAGDTNPPPPSAPESDEGSEPSEDLLAGLGLAIGEDGLCGLIAMVGLSGVDVCVSPGDRYRRKPAMAVRHVRKGIGRAA